MNTANLQCSILFAVTTASQVFEQDVGGILDIVGTQETLNKRLDIDEVSIPARLNIKYLITIYPKSFNYNNSHLILTI